MQINIAEMFSQTVNDVNVNQVFEQKEITFGGDTFGVVKPITLEMHLQKLGNDDYLADGRITATLSAPCSRCVEDVIKEVTITFTKELDTNVHDTDEELHEYLDGVVFDLEKMVLDEVYMNIPMKVLCSEDCLGICKSCGNNLNHAACDCEDDNIDPRLAGLKDLFKEV